MGELSCGGFISPFFNHCTGTDERRRTWEDGVVGLGRQPGSGSRSVGSWTTAPIPAGVVGSWLAARFLVQRRRFLFAAPDLGQRRRFADGIVGSLPAARGSSPALGLACTRRRRFLAGGTVLGRRRGSLSSGAASWTSASIQCGLPPRSSFSLTFVLRGSCHVGIDKTFRPERRDHLL